MSQVDRSFSDETNQEALWLLQLACDVMEGNPRNVLECLKLINQVIEVLEVDPTFTVDQRSGMLKWQSVSPYFDLSTVPPAVEEVLEQAALEPTQESDAGGRSLSPIRQFTAPLDWHEVIEWVDQVTIPSEIESAMP